MKLLRDVGVRNICGFYMATFLIFVLMHDRSAPPVFAQPNMQPAQEATMRAVLAQLQTMTTALHASPLAPPIGVFVRGIAPPFDPCITGTGKGNVAISQTASTQLVKGQSGLRVYVCAARVIAGTAEIVSFIEGTGAVCATGTAAVSGSTTAANGESYAANGGFSAGVGLGTIMLTTKPGDDLCLQQSTSNRLAGNITYVIAP